MASTNQTITMTLMLNQVNINAIMLYAVSIKFCQRNQMQIVNVISHSVAA